jgi:3D (Asp-Asp-Asp) domain-containing protein
MSCYFTTLQSDWGEAPDDCGSVRIYGKKYSGTVKNPPGLKGTYCSAFLAEMRLQGSGVLDSGQDLQYIGGTYKKVSTIHGKDGSVVVANKTLARSKTIIPAKGVNLDVDQIGTSLLANDTGKKIVGYRLDYYRGIGESVCSGFSNIMSVSACTPAQTACPASAVK